TIVNQHRGGRLPLHHVDLYRIERERELDEIGLDDLFRGDGVVAVEWCDRFPVLPADHLEVRLTVTGDQTRALDAEGRGARARQLAAEWAARLGRRPRGPQVAGVSRARARADGVILRVARPTVHTGHAGAGGTGMSAPTRPL